MAEKTPWEVDDTAITPQLLDAVKHVESRGNPAAVSPAGARGAYQFMPATAAQYGLRDPHDEPSAREAASRYLTDLTNRFGGDIDKALLAYNWGPGNVERYLKTGGPMPKEAQEYVGKVRAAQGKTAPESAPWEVDDTVKKYEQVPVSQTAKEMVKEDLGQALKSGIARSAMKTVRGVGTTLLPKAVETWLEQRGILPTAADITLLGEANKGSTAAGGAELMGDIATTMLPATRAMRGATTFAQAAPRAAAFGAGWEGTMAEEGQVPEAMLKGALLGAGGQAAASGIGHGLSRVLPSTVAMKEAMAGGLSPTMGQGVNPATTRGAIFKNFEDVASFPPLSGLPLRRAQDKSANQLLEQAVHTVDPNAVILPTARETVNALRESTRAAYRAPLDTVRMNLNQRAIDTLDQHVLDVARSNSLSPRSVARIQAEIEEGLSGVAGTSAPARVVENLAKDIQRGSGPASEEAARNEISRFLRNAVDQATEQAGMPMEAVRRARAGSYILKPGEVKGMSSSKLLDRVNRNQEKIGKDLVPELRTLAENAQGIEPARRAFGVSNPVRLLTELGGGTFTGGIANAGLAGYGALQHTALPRLLLGDPAVRDAVIARLRHPAVLSTILGASDAP
jgi:hypothetical protein